MANILQQIIDAVKKRGGTVLASGKSLVDAIGHNGTAAQGTGLDGKIGTPASTVSADVAAVKAETALIVADTGELQTDLVDGGRLDLLIDAIKAVTDALPDSGALTTIDGNVDDIETDTNEIQGDLTDGGRLDLLIDGIKAVTDVLPDSGALTTIDGNVDSILADTGELQTDWVNGGRLDLLIDAIKAATDNLPSDPADASVVAAAITAAVTSIKGTDVDDLKVISDQIDTITGAVEASALVTISVIAASETNILNLATASHVYQVRHLRIKSADPGAETMTVKLYEEINDVQLVVDTYTIDSDNYADYQTIMDMFGLPDLDGENLKVTAQMGAGSAVALTGQYVYSDVDLS